MFAVIRTGGKQYTVREADELRVERLDGDEGSFVDLTEVLMVGDTVGAPLVEGALVSAEIVSQGRHRKVIAFKKRRRQNSRRKIGHRQHFTQIRIAEILTGGKKPANKPTTAKKVAKAVEDTAGTAAETAKETAKKAAEVVTETLEDAASIATGSAATEKPEGPLFAAPEGEADKLTKIKGIGPVAEKQLNEQGITTFRQIAELSDDDIQRVDDYMPFSAAQIRDWQGQARELAK